MSLKTYLEEMNMSDQDLRDNYSINHSTTLSFVNKKVRYVVTPKI